MEQLSTWRVTFNHLLEQHTGGHNHELCMLVTVDFDQLVGSPGFNFQKAADKGLRRQKHGRCSLWK